MRRWKSSKTHPPRKGWYETRDRDGFVKWRAWGCGLWWSQLKDGWLGHFDGDGTARGYQWRSPRRDIKLDYAQVSKIA